MYALDISDTSNVFFFFWQEERIRQEADRAVAACDNGASAACLRDDHGVV